MLAAALILAQTGSETDAGNSGGAIIAIVSLAAALAVIVLVCVLLVRRTRAERTRQGTHRAGPGRS